MRICLRMTHNIASQDDMKMDGLAGAIRFGSVQCCERVGSKLPG